MSKQEHNDEIRNVELEKSKAHSLIETVQYIPHTVTVKNIIKKPTGKISLMSFDSGTGLTEKTSPFDTFVQIIDGKAEIVINHVITVVESGEGVILPAHLPNSIRPNGPFKMILTIIKSGYE